MRSFLNRAARVSQQESSLAACHCACGYYCLCNPGTRASTDAANEEATFNGGEAAGTAGGSCGCGCLCLPGVGASTSADVFATELG